MSTLDIAAAVAAMDFHVWDPSTRLCACGDYFEASLRTVEARKQHLASEIVRAGFAPALVD